MTDVSEWSPTTHCKQMRRQRGIRWESIAAAVENEQSEHDAENGCVIRSTWSDQHLVRVVLDPAKQHVVSVFRWCDKNDRDCHELEPAERGDWLPER